MAKTPGLASQIDGYLKGKGSPMAGLGHVFVAAGRKHGVDPRLVVGISGAESGFGKHLFTPHNAWGWGVHKALGRNWGSWEYGINTVTAGLAKGYISQGLKTPAQIVSKYAPSSDGNDESVWSNNVATFMRELGAAPAITVAKTQVPATERPTSTKTFTKTPTLAWPDFSSILTPPKPSTANLTGALMSNLGLIAQRGHLSGQGLLSGVVGGIQKDNEADEAANDAYKTAMEKLAKMPPPASAEEPSETPTEEPEVDTTGGLPTGTVFHGKTFKTTAGFPVPEATFIRKSTEHGTANLEGFDGYDYMAPSGSAAVAPVSGQVVWLSGHDPAEGPVGGNTHGAMGWSVYIRGNDNKIYYLTHMGQRDVQLGNTVTLGQKIGTVADWHKYGTPDHIHMGRGTEEYLPDDAKAYWANAAPVDGTASFPAPGSKKPPAHLQEAFYDPLGSWDSGRFGGAIGNHSDHVHLSIDEPQLMLAAIKLGQSMGLSVRENPYTDPVDPVHVDGSYHYRNFPGKFGGKVLGQAIDVSGPAEKMAAFYRQVTGA